MMATSEQARAALKIGNDRRLAAVRERDALRGKPADVIAHAIVSPTEALASMRLADLFGTHGRHRPGVIPRLGHHRLHRAFLRLVNEHPHGRQWWHDRLRLSELTQTERTRLAEALIEQAPASWRATSSPSQPTTERTTS